MQTTKSRDHDSPGLTSAEARKRLEAVGPNRPSDGGARSVAHLLAAQFKSPILLLLVFAAVLSGFLGDLIDSLTTVVIVVIASVLSFFQEYRADASVKALLTLVASSVKVCRDGQWQQIPEQEIVPGDAIALETGSAIPADGVVVVSDSLMTNESVLTGESMPCEKLVGSRLLAGTHVQSGSGTMVAEKTGKDTAFGAVAVHLRSQRPEPKFHAGVRRYGYLLVEFTLLLTMTVFAVNVWKHKPVLESFLFSLALAVGLTPQLLPAIMSLTLSKGAREMAKRNVVVKRLEAIEDFGSMTVLCSDKTGTLTEGAVTLIGAFDPGGSDDAALLHLARLNAGALSSYSNPIDAAILEKADREDGAEVLGQIGYDFFRKRASVLIREGTQASLLTKGALDSILGCCRHAPDVTRLYEEWSSKGFRVLGFATRALPPDAEPTASLEAEMTFRGFLVFGDPLSPDTSTVVKELREKGVHLKILTGDNRLAAAYVAKQVGLRVDRVMTGAELGSISTEAIAHQIRGVDVFAELDPVQKERLILAMRRPRAVVGYIGDGINDGAALHAADVGISVYGAVDVARQAADIIVLQRGLHVISEGIEEGRRIFANTLKYIYITTSANFGNMFSMAAASFFLPFLPLLPKQILLNNLLTDVPAMSIAGDAVDPESVQRPRGWDVRGLRKFMITFGLHSSVFDLLTFWILLSFLHADAAKFRSAWFMQSALSEIIILLIIRTRRPFFKSKPGPPLFVASIAVAVAVVLLPYLRLGELAGFVPLPPTFLAAIAAILCVYAITAELLKAWARVF